MPYVSCPRCGHRTFSVAYWSNREHCGNCGRELPSPRTVSDERLKSALAQPLRPRRDERAK